MNPSRRSVTFVLTLACLHGATVAAGLEGCGVTGSRRVTFRAEAAGIEREGGARGPMSFDTRSGWRVTLTEARAAIGPVYFNTLAPLEARTVPRAPWRSLLLPSAHAHGESHLGQGRIVAEINEQRVIDLLDPSPVPFERPVLGVDETVRTAELWFYNHSALEDAAIRVRGSAVRDGERVEFAGAFSIDPAAATVERPVDVLRKIRGVPFEFVPEDGVRITLRIDPRGWFADADFSELPRDPAAPAAPRRFTAQDNVGVGFEAGIRSARGTWNFYFDAAGTSRS
jgi:hypothetical protein